jgi:hypothetical protein
MPVRSVWLRLGSRRLVLVSSVLGILLVGIPVESGAQPTLTRGSLRVNGGYQITTHGFTNGAVKREHAEDGRFDTDYIVKGGPSFDVAVEARLWRRLGIGVGVSRFSVSTPASVRASLPHPFFFDHHRSVSGDASGLTREELAVHLQVGSAFPVGTRLQVMVFGGPSFFQVTQEIVTDFTYTNDYPYDEAQFAAATTINAKASKVGYNAGVDLAFFFTRNIGLGATAQFAGTTVALPAAGGASQDVKVGGVKVGGGLRLRF